MKKYIIFILFIIPLMSVFSAKPRWVTSLGIDTDYKEDKYLVGFGVQSDTGDAGKDLEEAKKYAERDVASIIKNNIVSTLEIVEEEVNYEMTSMSKISIQSTVSLDISYVNRKYDKYYDKAEKRYYVLCVIEKKSFIKDLETERIGLINDCESRIELIDQYLKKRDYKNANTEYIKFINILGELNQNYLIANFLKDGGEDLKKLNELFKKKGDIYNNIRNLEVNSLEDAANAIVVSFDGFNMKNMSFSFIPAYYKTTQISSEFFYYLAEYCTILVEKKGAVSKQIVDENDMPDYIFKGSFYNTRDGVKVLYSLTNANDDKKLAVSEIDFSNKFLTSTGFSILPDNMKIAEKDNKSFSKGQLENTKNVKFKITTNKGSQNLVFKKGEEVEFYVEVNKSGYISMLYHLAGDERLRTPLLENYYIPPSKVGKMVKIGVTFEVYPPFGAETAQFFFTSEPIIAFNTENVLVDGEEYEILKGDFEENIVKLRELKKSVKGLDYAESFITITTIP